MALSSGARLGPYEIQSAIGAGGMGEVYKARDTRLDRIVAIKVLPSHIAADPSLRERFEREARAISALEHPHICPLYDVGSEGGTDFIVMQYLDGETLATRLAKGPLPLDQALKVGVEIAAALDAAHRRGIVHRDLKPGNVMLTKSGAKLLDFGLAKTAAPAVNTGTTILATGAPLTAQGTILGTLQYMAPEQIEGRDADARTDIFALGVILYEMITGKRAFEGRTHASLIAAILEREPPSLRQAAPVTPPMLEAIVQRTVAKDPDDRWGCAHDLHAALEVVRSAPVPASGPAAAPSRVPWAVVAAALVLAIAAIAWTLLGRVPAPAGVSRLVLPLAPAQRLAAFDMGTLALSPGGDRAAFVGWRDGRRVLFLRDMERGTTTEVPNSVDALGPSFSPDGRWVIFGGGQQLMKAPVEGGPPLAIGKNGLTAARGIAWMPDDTLILQESLGTGPGDGGLERMPASGGAAVLITKLAEGEQWHRWPAALPGGRAIVYAAGGAGGSTIIAEALDGSVRRAIASGSAPRYLPTGHLVFGRDGAIHGMAFDPDRLEVRGSPFPLVQGVLMMFPGSGSVVMAVSDAGTLMYVPAVEGQQGGSDSLARVGQSAVEILSPLLRLPLGDLRVSPDGSKVAFDSRAGGLDVWVYDLKRASSTRLTFNELEDETPEWSPDGSEIAYASWEVPDQRTVSIRRADGAGEARVVHRSRLHVHVVGWTPDRRSLILEQADSKTGRDIVVLDLGGQGSVRPFLNDTFNEAGAALSPDGRWLAYQSTEFGRDEIFVTGFPDGSGKWQVSANGGTEPAWSRDGRQLLFRSGGRMQAVPVTTAPTFTPGTPRALFEDSNFSSSGVAHRDFDIAPDGSVLFIRDDTSETSQPQVVINWFSEVMRLIPLK